MASPAGASNYYAFRHRPPLQKIIGGRVEQLDSRFANEPRLETANNTHTIMHLSNEGTRLGKSRVYDLRVSIPNQIAIASITMME